MKDEHTIPVNKIGHMQRGFSLVELSIVLVILGLLTGGILAGQSLIRASELRSISSDLSRYTTALQSFRDRYLAIPGDMANATSFWGKDNTNCPTHTGTAATNGTCNGDGAGSLSRASSSSSTGETFQFWRQLALAGLIEGTYSGIAGSSGSRHAVIGTNVPSSKITMVGYSPDPVSGMSHVTWASITSNTFIIGKNQTPNPTEGAFLKPEELWNIDTKIDDGKPAYGKIMPFYRYSYASGNQCSTSDTAAAAEYAVSGTSQSCNMLFVLPF